MTPSDPVPSPRLARWLLRRVLDGKARSAIIGDLEEEFTCFAVPRLGLRRARWWYWCQAGFSIAACVRGRADADLDPDAPSFSHTRQLMFDRHGLGADLRAAVRFCVRSPLTSVTVILTLAIGVGASTAVFALANAVLFKPLPIANADRLVNIRSRPGGMFTYPEYLESTGAAGLHAAIAGGRTSATMGEGQARRRVMVEIVSANYFDALGTAPAARGRLLAASDDASGSAPVVVLSHAFWRRELAGSATAVGATVRLNRAFFTVVGIAPEGFAGTHPGFGPDAWIPLTQAPQMEGNPAMLGPGSSWLGLLGILEHADSLATAQAALAAPWKLAGSREAAVLTPIPRGMSGFGGDAVTQLRVFSLFVVLILTIACLNVATLLGGIVHERRKELAIRSSLGAGRVRLLRQLLAEHLLLAAVGGTLGGLLGTTVARGLGALLAGPVTPTDLDVGADRNVVVFTIALTLVVGLAVGLMPAIRWSRASTLVELQGGGAGMRRLLRTAGLWWLIPWQVALGTVLLASAGSLATTVQQLKRGIGASAPERVWFADLRFDAVSTPAEFESAVAQLRDHLRALPGAEGAALATNRPLASTRRGPLRVEGMTTVPESSPMPWGAPPPPPPPAKGPRGPATATVPPAKRWLVSNNYVGPGFFASLALPVVRGRDFTDADSSSSRRVAIVNETLASRAFGAGDPIGRRVAWGPGDEFDITIVGVVRDLRSEHLRIAAPDAIFFPLAQVPLDSARTPTPTGGRDSIDLNLVLRAGERTPLGAAQLRRHVFAFDPQLFVDRVWTFDDEAGRSLSRERLLARAGSILGFIALALLVVGLYGTLTAAVVRGRRELGIRLALGAMPRTIGAMVVGRGLAVGVAGLVLGLPLSYAATRSFAHLLYGVRPAEPLVIGASIAIILATVAIATCVPARRASRVDPLVVLRTE
jgi:putative ABC transport system permease protein